MFQWCHVHIYLQVFHQHFKKSVLNLFFGFLDLTIFLNVFFEDILIQTVWSKIHVPLICQCCIIKPILEVFCFCELEMLSFYIAILHWMKCMVAKKNKTVVISFMLECVAVCVYFKFAISEVHLLKICRIVSLYLTYKIFVFKV